MSIKTVDVEAIFQSYRHRLSPADQTRVEKRLAEHPIRIPFPRRDLHLKRWDPEVPLDGGSAPGEAPG